MHSPFLIFTILLLPSIATASITDDIDRWCGRTPYPSPCAFHLHRHLTLHHPLDPTKFKNTSQFYTYSLHSTVDLAAWAAYHFRQLPNPPEHSSKAAVEDCLLLYDHAVLQLNRTLEKTRNADGAIDMQTWLSTALTNVDFCRNFFHDASFIDPVFRYDLPQLISNLLSVNREAAEASAIVCGGDDSSTCWTTIARRNLLQYSSKNPDIVVANDGSGDFLNISAALESAAVQMQNSNSGFIIYVKRGVYNENLLVNSGMTGLTMIGDGINNTIITGDRSVGKGYTTVSSATFSILADNFTAINMTFRNTNGPGTQAVALLSASDRSVFYRCSFEGYQDTLLTLSQRQFYRECDIYGIIDFIFGNAAAVIQNCNIYARLPLHGEYIVITAQGRTDPNQNTGIVIQFCNISPTQELREATDIPAYLGRPWKEYSRTVYMESYMDEFINAAGWDEFSGDFGLDTLYYAEYKNSGPGADTSGRVKWLGYHLLVRKIDAQPFTVVRFINGKKWIQSTGVPFSPSL